MAEEALHREVVEAAPKPRKTWYEWATGASATEEVPISIDWGGGELELSDEQRSTLAALLSGGAEAATSAPQEAASSEYVEHALGLTLDELSLTLIADPIMTRGPPRLTSGGRSSDVPGAAIARLSLSTFTLSLDSRVAGLRAEGSLNAVELIDCQAPLGSIGRALLQPAADDAGGSRPSGTPPPALKLQHGASTGRAHSTGREPQWRFRVVQRPQGQPEDFAVSLTVASPLEIVHNAPLLRRIAAFFAVASETERAELARLVGDALVGATQALKELTGEALAAILARRTTTAVSLKLAAPRIILPEDLTNPSSPLLILDMGAISVSSLSGAAAATGDETAAIKAAEGAALPLVDGAAATAALYDQYAVELSSMQVLMAPADVAWRSEWEQVRQKLHVVHKFGLQLELRSCILPAGAHGLEQFLVTGALSNGVSPSIEVRLNSRQLRTLANIARSNTDSHPSATPADAGDPHAATPATPAKWLGTPAKGSTPASPSRDSVERGPPGGSAPARAVLSVQRVVVILSDESGGAERELAVMKTNDISLELSQLPVGQVAKFSVGSLVVEDHTRPTRAGWPVARLLDSAPAALVGHGVSRSEPAELVHLEYHVRPEGQPDEMHVHFSQLHVEWNPETVAALLAFFKLPPSADTLGTSELPPSLGGGTEDGDDDDFRSVGSGEGGGAYSEAGGAGDGLKVVARLESLSVSLNAERSNERLALLAMKQLSTKVWLPAEGGMVVSGQLGNLTAQDTLTRPSAPYEMLGLRASEGSLLSFEYESPADAAREKARASGAYDSSVKVRMSSVQVAYWHAGVMRTVRYLQSGVLGALMSATANTVAQMARSVLDPEVSAMSLDVEVDSPLVLLPTHAGGAVGLRADLGRIAVRNSLVRRAETNAGTFGVPASAHDVVLDAIHVTIEKMHVDSVDTGASASTAMLRDASLDLLIERGIGPSTGRPLFVECASGELACDCSKVQYDLLMHMLVSNLASRGDRFYSEFEPASQLGQVGGGVADEEPSSPPRGRALLDGSLDASMLLSPPQAKPADMVVTFRLPLLTLRIADAVPFGASRPLAQLALQEMRVRYSSVTDGPSSTELSLGALHVHDELRGGLELLSSVHADDESVVAEAVDAAARGAQTELAGLQYRNTLPGQPNELMLRFSRLHIEWNPETVAALLTFAKLPPSDAPPTGTPAAEYGMASSMMGASMYMSAMEVAGGGSVVGGGGSVVGPTSSSVAGAQQVESEDGDDDFRSVGSGEGGDGGRAGDGLKVVARLESLSVSLNAERSNERLALLAMKQLSTKVWLPAEGGMVVSGQLGNLTAQDTLTRPSAPYEMLGLRASEGSLLSFEYESPADAAREKARASGAYDSSVKVRMSSVQVAYWHAGVMRTVRYLQSGVLGALMSATANTVAQMARSVLDPEVSAMSLDVEVDSPLVLLPTHAGGAVGLRADLGRIAVRNSLVRRAETNAGTFGVPASAHDVVLDAIHVTIEKMHVDSVDTGASASTAMLRDASLDLLIERGIGPSLELPLSVEVHAGELACDCSKVQYDLLMRMLVSNLASRADPLTSWQPDGTEIPQLPSAAIQPATAPATAVGSRAIRRSRAGALSGGEGVPPLSVVAKLELSGATLRLADANGPLLSSSLRGCTVQLKYHTNGNQEVTLSCHAVELCATHASESGGIERLLWGDHTARSHAGRVGAGGGASITPPQLHVVYSAEDDGESRMLVANLHGTQVNLVYETFAGVAGFFVSADEAPPPACSSTAAETQRATWTDGLVSSAMASTDVPTGSLVVLFSLEASQLMLPRTPEAAGSDGIVLSGASVLKYRRDGNAGEQVDVEIMQLQLFVCPAGGLGRPPASGAAAADGGVVGSATILAPADLSLKGTRGPSHLGSKLEVSLLAAQAIELYISYNDCKLALHILDGLHASSLRAGASGPASRPATPPLPPPPEMSQSLATSGAAGLPPVPPAVAPAAKIQLSGSLQVEGVRLVLLNDFNGRAVPLVSTFYAPLAVSGTGEPSHFMVDADIGVTIDVYNASVCKWEPLVENCSFRASTTLQHKPGDIPVTDMRLEAPHPCNINLSPSICSLLSSTVLTLADDVAGVAAMRPVSKPFMCACARSPPCIRAIDSPRLTSRVRVSRASRAATAPLGRPYSITNHTGVPLRYGRARAGRPEALLVPGATEEFNFWPEASERSVLCAWSGGGGVSLAIACHGWTPIEEVPIDLVSKRILQLFPIAGSAAGGSGASPSALASADGAPAVGRALSGLPCHVVVEGLASRPDINGKHGRAIDFDALAGRYHVVMNNGGELLALRAPNLREVVAAYSHGGDGAGNSNTLAADAVRSQNVLMHVTLVDDQKCVAIYSMSQLTNQTTELLDVRLRHPQSGEETIHPLPPGERLPLPLCHGHGVYHLCLRPATSELDWSAFLQVPGADHHAALDANAIPLACRPAMGAGGGQWHALLHHGRVAPGAVCELAVQPTFELRNLLAGPLRLELLGSGASIGRTLTSGETLRTHAFATDKPVSLSVQVWLPRLAVPLVTSHAVAHAHHPSSHPLVSGAPL